MHFDVAIVGYGPVGALAALSLADAGLHVLVLERSTDPTDLPRAVGLDGETLRAFQRLGLGEEVSSLCQPPRDPNEIRFVNSRREALFGLDIPVVGPNGWCDLLFFDQPELEVALRRIVASNDRIDVRLGQEVIRPFYARRARHARGRMREALDGCEYFIHRPEGAFFLWLWLPDLPITSAELYERLKARGVFVIPGHHFFPGLAEEWSHRDQCIRISYSQDENAVREGIRIIGEEVKRAKA